MINSLHAVRQFAAMEDFMARKPLEAYCAWRLVACVNGSAYQFSSTIIASLCT